VHRALGEDSLVTSEPCVREVQESPAQSGPSLLVLSTSSYATALRPLLCATILPLVIFGAFGIAVPRF